MLSLSPPPLQIAVAGLLALSAVGVVQAERGDRTRPMTLESDKPCVANYLKKTSQCSGNVVIAQGTLQLRAERLELRETPEGWQQVLAQGNEAGPARVRQKRDGLDETIEGQAQLIDYDSRSGRVKFEGAAVVRRLRAGVVVDEMQGASILWDGMAEELSVQGGAATAANPGGRVRAVITPRGEAAAAASAEAASAALKNSATLGERR